MQAIAPIMGLAASGFSAMGSMQAAGGQAAADQYQAQLLEREAQYGQLAATQTNATMTRELSSTLARVDAIRAASHTNPASPTGAEVRGQTEFLGNEAKETRVGNILAQSQMDESQAAYERYAASRAMMAGQVGAAGDIFGGLTKAIGGLNFGA
jgi:hypothetical protein